MTWNLHHSYASLPGDFGFPVEPTPVREPKLVLLNRALSRELGLDPETLAEPQNAGWFTGNEPLPGARPLAQAYAGHQYGHFVRLGDGRAHLLGEQITPSGQRFDIQLKGSGPTPYSRRGDGRAAIGPMLREFMISEAMHALGIPTTRSLAVATTGEMIFRDGPVPGAVLTRVASSHIRVGTFEWAAATGNRENLLAIANYTRARHYPKIPAGDHVGLYRSIVRIQAELIARWQLVGFVHGVMNTDNMALSGETIDYGPCAFMDHYDPATVFSSIDHHGRYAYANQPRIAQWNLAQLASAMLPLFHQDQDAAITIAREILDDFPDLYQSRWLDGMRNKFGLFGTHSQDQSLAEDFLTILHQRHLDYTNAFADLTRGIDPSAGCQGWFSRWQDRLGSQSQSWDESCALMRQHNPAYIPRNHKVEEALAAASEAGDTGPLEALLEIVARPYDHDAVHPGYNQPAPSGDHPYRTFCGT